jgi:hypothetical protein
VWAAAAGPVATARLLNRHPAWTVADMLGELRSNLLNMAAERDTVAAAFQLPYDHLPPQVQRTFHHLALHPGEELEPYAVGALTGLPADEAAGHLNQLQAQCRMAMAP